MLILALIISVSVSCAITAWGFWIGAVFNAFCLVMAIKILVGECMRQITDCEAICYLILRWINGVACAGAAIVALILAIVAWSSPSKFQNTELSKALATIWPNVAWLASVGFMVYTALAAWFMGSQSAYKSAVDFKIATHLLDPRQPQF